MLRLVHRPGPAVAVALSALVTASIVAADWHMRPAYELAAVQTGGANAASAAGVARLAEPADRFVTVNGLKLHYVEWGDAQKPPLILIHGISRFARTFDHLVPAFVDRYRVIAYDLRGHGDS